MSIAEDLDELERLGKNLSTTQPFARETLLETVASLREKLKFATTGGAALILGERTRQVRQEKWTPEHDDEHHKGELVAAAICYAADGAPTYGIGCSLIPGDKVYAMRSAGPKTYAFVDPWPWEDRWDKRGRNDPGGKLRKLAKAGALLAAEMDRVIRADEKAKAKAQPG